MQTRTSEENSFVACLFWTFLFGLAAHAFYFFNSAFSHDALDQFVWWDTKWQISLGRYLQPLIRQFYGRYNTPWLTGMIGLFFLAAAACLIARLFSLRRRTHVAVLCGLLCTNRCVTLLIASYSPWFGVFMLSMFLAVAAAYLLDGGWLKLLAGAGCVFVSMALYQCYITVCIGLVMLLFLRRALENRPPRELILYALKGAGMVLLGGLVYAAGVFCALRFSGLALADSYNSLKGAGDFTGVSVPMLLFKTYIYFLRFFVKTPNISVVPVVAVNAVLALAALGALVRLIRAGRVRPANVVLIALCLLVLPLGLNAVYVIAKGTAHLLMVYSFILAYVFSLFLFVRAGEEAPAEPPRSRAWRVRGALFALLCALLFENICFANGAYLKRSLESDACLSYMTRAIDRMEQTEGYVPGETPVVFVGNIGRSPAFNASSAFDPYKDQIGLMCPIPIMENKTYGIYLADVLNYNANIVPAGEAEALAQSPEVQALPRFPAAGSVQIIDGTLYVRFS